jgi:CRP-like cAMP-binding protein
VDGGSEEIVYFSFQNKYRMKQFSDFIQSKVSVDENDLAFILAKFKKRIIDKGQYLLKKGQTANQYYFIKSGGLRFSFGELDSRDTSWVVFQDEFFTEISSLLPQKPTRFDIEAIEETELLYIEKLEMEQLYRQFPSWQEFGRKIWQEMSVRMIEQIVSFQTLSAEERYLDFLKTPELLQRVPVKHLASILGITPNALSRIRRNIR